MRINPAIPLPIDTPKRMVEHWKLLLPTASPDFQIVLKGLIEKWDKDGWHAPTFHFLHYDGGCGVKIANFDDLYGRCVFI